MFATTCFHQQARRFPTDDLSHEPDPDDPWVRVAMGIGDAYLSVPQTRLVIVTHAGVNYILGRVLPGQRDGSKEWYLAFSSFLGGPGTFLKKIPKTLRTLWCCRLLCRSSRDEDLHPSQVVPLQVPLNHNPY